MLRILSSLCADGATQMALDEALLEAAGPTTLRCYTWDPPTVSLGYFQDHATVAAALPPGTPMVRRITGGGAIWHQHEVTYCLVGELGRDGLPARSRDCYAPLHRAIASAIAQRGGTLEHQAATVGDRRYREEPRCFASPAAEDLVHPAGGKVLGSAARTRGHRILLHGSLKLDTNPWDGPASRGCGLDAAAAEAALVAGVAAALALEPVPGQLEDAERRALSRIRGARYSDAAWVRYRQGPRP